MSVRLKLTLSYAAFLMVAGIGLIAVVLVFLLRYVPDHAVVVPDPGSPDGTHPSLFIPGRSDLWAAFAPKATLMLGLLLVIGLVGGWLLAGRMLAPLNRITAATRAAGAGSLSHRIGLTGANDEFHELADSFDMMLGRLEAHVAEQQRFAANASHELRTPLAITRTLLEVAQRDPDRDPDELLDRLALLNTRAIDLTESLLLLSRAESVAVDSEPVDLSLLAEEATETLLPLAERSDVTLSSSGEIALASGSPSLLLQLTMNLVHNGIVHNLPTGGTVRVTTRQEERVTVLVVENTGEPLSPEVVATLTEPFRRGTERVHTDQAGVGLGLAIVERITRAHGGELRVGARPEGGLRVVVSVPRHR